MKGLKEYIVSSWNKFKTKCVNKFKGRPDHSTSGYKYIGKEFVRLSIEEYPGSLQPFSKLQLAEFEQV